MDYTIKSKSSPAYLVVAFARPESTTNLLKFLSERNRRVYLFIDKPQSRMPLNDELLEVASFYKEKFKINVKISEFPNGPQRGVESALNWIFEYEDFVVTLEDDSDIDDQSLEFFSKGLKLLTKEVVILSSRGQSRSSKNHFCEEGSHLSRFAFTNGWLTSRDFWENNYQKKASLWGYFRVRLKGLNSVQKFLVWCFFYSGTFQFDRNLGKVCWDQKVVFTLLRDNLMSFIPNKTMVGNLGVDQVASNTIIGTSDNQYLFHKDEIFPNLNICVNVECLSGLENTFLEIYGVRLRNFLSPFLALGRYLHALTRKS